MDWVCARGKGIHAREGEIMDWVLPEVREHMRKEKKDEIGMCQRQENT